VECGSFIDELIRGPSYLGVSSPFQPRTARIDNTTAALGGSFSLVHLCCILQSYKKGFPVILFLLGQKGISIPMCYLVPNLWGKQYLQPTNL